MIEIQHEHCWNYPSVNDSLSSGNKLTNNFIFVHIVNKGVAFPLFLFNCGNPFVKSYVKYILMFVFRFITYSLEHNNKNQLVVKTIVHK